MKISKNIFICALLVLMLLVCVNAASAEETFNETLGADAIDEIAVEEAPVDELSANAEEIGEDAVSSADDGGEILSASDADPELAAGSTVYVSTTGSDSNDGLSEANAVATINHAVDIADGKIVILAGEYTVTSLLNVTKDLEITGQGDVTIKSNSKYGVEVWDDWDEEWTTENHYTLINNSANLYLNNIKFTLVPASIADQLINNVGKLYVNTCEFNNIKITSGRGVIQNVKGAYLEVKDTTFKTASSTYGAINNNGELLVDGCKFLDNDRSSDSGIYSTAITSYNKATILNSQFDNNKGTAGGAVYVMYSYTNKENPVMEIKNCTFTNNNAPGTSYSSGTGGAVKCSGKAVTLTIEDSTFTGNNAKNGGAVYAEGNVTIINSVFHGNTASIGEDVYVASGSNTAVLGCTVDDNSHLWQANGGNLTIGDAPEELTNIVTQDNFYNFFDEDGMLLDTVPFDELIFQGEFSDLGAGYVIITKPITITGDGAKLNNMGIVVSSSDVSLNNLTLNANIALGDLVNVVESNVKLSNLNITYIVNDEAARAVSIIGALNVIADNLNITFESHITDSTVDACAINIEQSGDVSVTDSEINSSLPALLVNYDMSDSSPFMGLNQVNPVRIVGSSNVNITKSTINSKTNDYSQLFATIQAILVLESSNCLVDSNNITLTDDFAQVDQDIYLYGITFAYDEGLVMSNNNFTIFTNGGKEAAGTAYAIQGIESDLSIISNNITTFSNGPNLGIYVTSMAGEGSTMIIEKNIINVTGLAAVGNNWALVSGIEIQNGDAKVYNNTIYTYNVDEYDEDDYLSGISYIQYMYGGRTFDIQDNTVYTTGKYPIYIIDASNSIITGNTLYGHELTGDDAVYIQSGENNIVKDNLPIKVYEGIIYVNTTGNDNNLGSIDAPVASVAKAVELAQGKSGQIIIDQGAYEFEATVEIRDDLNISTVGDVVLVGPGSTSVKAFRIYSGDVSISNLTFINFNASNYGAAIRVDAGSLTFDGVKFIKNGGEYRDALVYVRNADLTLINSIFEDNTAHKTSTSYGTVSVGTGTLYMDNCNFTNNHNKYGCLYLSNIIATIYNSSFVGNNATSASAGTGAGIYVSGASTTQYSSGGTVFQGSASYVLVQNCNFINNTAFGASRYPGQGGAIYVNNNVTMFIVDSLFENNTAQDGTNDKGQGGAIFASAGNIKINGSTFKNNSATQGNDIYMKYYTSYMVDPSGVNELYISDSIILSGDNSVVSDTTNGIYVANNNWWGTNDEPASKVSEGITVDSWAKMNATFTPADAKTGDEVTVTATFDNVNLPDGINVTFTSTSGNLNTVVATVDGKATTTYTIDANDDSIIATSTDVAIEMPIIKPLANITVDDVVAWIGTDATVTVNVPNATGTVTIEVNGKSYDVDLVDGVATKDIPAEDLVAGENTVTATYNGRDFASNSATGVITVIDGVVTQDNYMLYFNQDDNGKFFDYIPEGATLDFQGSIINPDQAITVQMNVNKPVNIITTTGDAYVDLNTTAGSLLGESPGNSFAVTRGGSGSNVTGIAFHNTQLWISNTTHVVLDNISNVVEDQRVGSGVGATSIRDNSTYVTLKNSYFYTRNNGGSTTFTFAWASYCIMDNCTVKAEGNVGNLVYLNIFNVAGAPTKVPLNNNNTVSNNKIYGKEGSAISVGLMVEGADNLIINNTLYKSSIGTSFGGFNPANNTYVGNTVTDGSSLTALANSVLYNNNVSGSMTVPVNSIAYNNTVGGRLTVSGAGSEVYNNTVGSLTVSQANAYVHDNVIKGAVSLAANAANANFTKNNVTGTVTVAANAAVSITENNIISTGDYAVDLGAKNNKVVTDNLLVAKELVGDAAVKSTGTNNTIENNRPVPAVIVVAADNITVGQVAVINVTLEDGANGAVNLIVDGKSYAVDIVDGQGQVTVEGLTASDYTAAAYFETSDIYFLSSENSTVFNVAKLETVIAIDVLNATLGENAAVVVSIPNATGSVKIIIDGVEHAVNLEDGQATYTIEDIAAGDYNVVAFFAGDKNYDAASNSTTFTVAKLTPEIIVDVPAADYGSDALITIEIANATGNVFVDVGANKYYAELENGVATVTVPKVTENATVTVKYDGDDKCEANTASAELIVNKLTTVLSGSDVTLAYKEGGWEVTLTDAEGNAIADAIVKIGINTGSVEKVYSRVTDANGVAKLPISLAAGDYAVNATFEETDMYQSSFVNATVTVTPAAPVLTGGDLVMNYKDGSAWEVTLTDAEGNAIANAAVKIGITINGVEKIYNRKTDADGIASLPINVAPGEYAVSATFEGNKKYAAASVNATVTVAKNDLTLSDEDLTMTYKDGSSYKVNVVDAEGNAVADVKVKVTVGGKDYNIKSNSEGVAELPINLALGNYTVTAVVDEADCESNEISSVISVTTDNLAIVAGDVNMTYKDGTAYEVQLVDAEGNPVALANQIVKVTVKGKTYDRKTNANGIASLTINLGAGTYDITAEYNGIVLNNNVTVVKA